MSRRDEMYKRRKIEEYWCDSKGNTVALITGNPSVCTVQIKGQKLFTLRLEKARKTIEMLFPGSYMKGSMDDPNAAGDK